MGPILSTCVKEEKEKAIGSSSKMKLYSWNGSPPCLKVIALLNYYDEPYALLEVDNHTKSEIRWPGSDFSMVPQMILGGRTLLSHSSTIMRKLYPMLSGRDMTDEECEIETQLITKGFMLAYEIDMFTAVEDVEKILSMSYDYVSMTFAYQTFAGTFEGSALPAILSAAVPADVRRANPKLLRSAEYLIELRAHLGSRVLFSGGSIPGPVDLALWGAVAMSATCKLSCFPGPLLTSDLMDWYERMAAIMSAHQPVVCSWRDHADGPTHRLVNNVTQRTTTIRLRADLTGSTSETLEVYHAS